MWRRRVTTTVTPAKGSWATSRSKTAARCSPFLGPSATAAARASPQPCRCLRARPGPRFARGLGEVRHGAAAGGTSVGAGDPRPRLRRRRAGPPSSRVGGPGDAAGGRAGARPAPLPGWYPAAPPTVFGLRRCTVACGVRGAGHEYLLSSRSSQAVTVPERHDVPPVLCARLTTRTGTPPQRILESAKLTAIAAAPRMPSPGRPAGAAAAPGAHTDETPGLPKAAGQRFTPCRSSSAWRSVERPDRRRGGSAERTSSRRRTTTSAASGWARPRRGCFRTRTSRQCSAACSPCRLARSRSS